MQPKRATGEILAGRGVERAFIVVAVVTPSLRTRSVNQPWCCMPAPLTITVCGKGMSLRTLSVGGHRFPGRSGPEWLKGELPGDFGFDPFHLAKDPAALKWYQQAELQNGRCAPDRPQHPTGRAPHK